MVQVVSQHLQLKKAGGDRMVGICPFHSEKTPSFSVTPSKQVYYCFGCGEGGDVFTFLQKVEDLSFGEAAERLAREAGITLRYEGQTEGDRQRTGRRQMVHRVRRGGDSTTGPCWRAEGADARAYLGSQGSRRRAFAGSRSGTPPTPISSSGGWRGARRPRCPGGRPGDEGQRGQAARPVRGRVMFPITTSPQRGGVRRPPPGTCRAGGAGDVAKYVNPPSPGITRGRSSITSTGPRGRSPGRGGCSWSRGTRMSSP
jgi:DNA primase